MVLTGPEDMSTVSASKRMLYSLRISLKVVSSPHYLMGDDRQEKLQTFIRVLEAETEVGPIRAPIF